MFKNILLSGGRLIVGIAIKNLINWSFDFVLYPTVLVLMGYLWGGVIMTVLAAVLNIFIIRTYDWAKVDWFFIEKLKHVKDDNTDELPRLLHWLRPILQRGNIPAFFILCYDDPVTATLYLRKGSYKFDGLSSDDWKIFAAANIVANVYWILQLGAVIELFKFAST